MYRPQIQNEGILAQSPLDAAVAAVPKEAVALKCPSCAAPLPPRLDPSTTELMCEYCGVISTLRDAEEEMERLRNDVKNWISQIVSDVRDNVGVDSVSRRYIFNQLIMPKLDQDVRCAIEPFQDADFCDMPLLALPLFLSLKGSHFSDMWRSSPENKDDLKPVREVIAKTQSLDMLPFAVSNHEKMQLISREAICKEIIEFDQIRRGLSESTKLDATTHGSTNSGFYRALKNLRDAYNLHNEAATISSAVNKPYSELMQSLSIWLSSVERTVEVLARLKQSGSAAPTVRDIDELDEAARACDQAAFDIDASSSMLRGTRTAPEGCRDDAKYIKILADSARICYICKAESGDDFYKFLDYLKDEFAGKHEDLSNVSWLADSLSNLVLQLAAISGEAEMPFIIDDFEWAPNLGKQMIGKKWFGMANAETFELEDKLLVPFWVAEVNFSKKEGTINIKARPVPGLLFLDAAREGNNIHAIRQEDYLFEECKNKLGSPRSIDSGRAKELAAVVPLITRESAENRMKHFIDSQMDILPMSKVSARIFCLPGMIGLYTKMGKNEERRMLMMNIPERLSMPIDRRILQLGNQKLLSVEWTEVKHGLV